MACDCCNRRIWRYKPADEPGLRARWWLPAAGPHLDPLEWAGPIDPETGFPLPTADAPDFDVINNSTNVNDSGSGAGAARYGIISGWVYLPEGVTHWRDNNTNTGELGMVLSGDCCGGALVEQPGGNHDTSTVTADRTLMDATPVTAGWHYVVNPQSDTSAFQGLDLEYSLDGTGGPWVNVSRQQATKPEIESFGIPCCQKLSDDDIAAGWGLDPLQPCCQPRYTAPAQAGGLDAAAVQALIAATPHVRTECAGPFVLESARTGWWAGWTPTTTANTGTVEIIDWRALGGAVTSPDCVTDLVVQGDVGSHYLRARRARAYMWIDARLLVNGAAVWTRTNEKYRYIDERDRHTTAGGAPGVPVNIEPWGGINGGRLAIPASAAVELQVRVRWNANGFQDNGWVRYIGGLRSQTIFTFHHRTELLSVAHA